MELANRNLQVIEEVSGTQHRSGDREAIRASVRALAHLFQVPICYVALLGNDGYVFTRIGFGVEHWQKLSTLPIAEALRGPQIIRDSAKETLPAGADLGDLRFAASAPLRTGDGTFVGLLVMSDHVPRPAFNDEDVHALAELARLIATSIEFADHEDVSADPCFSHRTDASAEEMMDALPLPVLCVSRSSNCCGVNRAWLAFTGHTLFETSEDGWLDCVHPEDIAGLLRSFQIGVNGSSDFVATLRILSGTGEYTPMQVQGAPESAQRPPERFVLVFSSIR